MPSRRKQIRAVRRNSQQRRRENPRLRQLPVELLVSLLRPARIGDDNAVVGFGIVPVLHHRHAVTAARPTRSEEHTSELQSLMRNSYAVFCLKKKTTQQKEQ